MNWNIQRSKVKLSVLVSLNRDFITVGQPVTASEPQNKKVDIETNIFNIHLLSDSLSKREWEKDLGGKLSMFINLGT